MRHIIILLATISVLIMDIRPGYAFDWTSSNVQLLYGDDFELGVDERTTITVEHGNGWKYGNNFFFADIIYRSDIDLEVYAEVYTYLSLNKISGRNLSVGPINDFSLVAGLNISNEPRDDPFRVYLFGLSLDLNNPAFDYLQLDINAYKSDSISGRYGIQVTPVWSMPFQIGAARFKFRGFVDFRNGNTNSSGNFQMLAQPQLLLDIGDLVAKQKDLVFLGTEYSYWLNKFGLEDVDESVLQAMLIVFF